MEHCVPSCFGSQYEWTAYIGYIGSQFLVDKETKSLKELVKKVFFYMAIRVALLETTTARCCLLGNIFVSRLV